MASAELKKAFDEYESYIAKNGVSDVAVSAYCKALDVCFSSEMDYEYGWTKTELAKQYIDEYVKNSTGGGDIWFIDKVAYDNGTKYEILDQFYRVLKYEAFVNFESYMYYMEKDRDPKKRFYYPRRKTLRVVADDFRRLENGEWKFYGLSMPSRTGKSTIAIFFLSWVGLRKPNSHSAMGGHSGILAKGFYKELMNLIASNEYRFSELFSFWNPNMQMLQDKSAEDLTITLGDVDRFATYTMRGIDGTWTGAVDISGGDPKKRSNNCGYLYVDDLVRDREHSLSPTRMENTWQEYLNKMVDRKNDGAKELMIGTLWNVLDPLERMFRIYGSNPEYKFRRIPALDDNDESNFDYEINGFSTRYYREMRERLDAPEWMAKYQQRPYVREGLLYEGLKEFDYDDVAYETMNVIGACDPALGGGDFLSFPICRYDPTEKERYIIDWVYTNKSTKTSVPEMADAIFRNRVAQVIIEDDGKSAIVSRELKEELDRRGYNFCTIIPKHSNNRISKDDRIKGTADAVKDNYRFLKSGSAKRSSEYDEAMSWLKMYTSIGKNIHDDAPDSLSMLELFFKPLAENGIDIPEFNPFRDTWVNYG